MIAMPVESKQVMKRSLTEKTVGVEKTTSSEKTDREEDWDGWGLQPGWEVQTKSPRSAWFRSFPKTTGAALHLGCLEKKEVTKTTTLPSPAFAPVPSRGGPRSARGLAAGVDGVPQLLAQVAAPPALAGVPAVAGHATVAVAGEVFPGAAGDLRAGHREGFERPRGGCEGAKPFADGEKEGFFSLWGEST